MSLLINEPPLQVLPSLAAKIGLNEAMFLQQLHFRLQISTNIRDNYKWIYKTYQEWQGEFPFWSVETVKRTITKLEKSGYIITTSDYNKMKMDKTKWYRIDYTKLINHPTGQNDLFDRSKCSIGEGQSDLPDEVKMTRAIPKEIKKSNNNVDPELNLVHEIINYLNNKAHKNFKSRSTATRKLINGRLKEGYTLEDFKRVIDVKTQQWLNNPEMNKYLQPSTLFSPSKFENYLNENLTPRIEMKSNMPSAPSTGPLNLNFNAGEDM